MKHVYYEVIATGSYPLHGCTDDNIIQTISEHLAGIGLTVSEVFSENVDDTDPRIQEGEPK